MTDYHHTDAASSFGEERTAAYAEAHAAAQPDPGRQVVAVETEAREIDWEFVPGVSTGAWGFNGMIPGPVLEATVGDVLEIRLTNRWMPDDRPGGWMYHCHILELHAAGMMAHFDVVR